MAQKPRRSKALTDKLLKIYQRMEDHFGPTGWWPAETPFEVAVGAVLTQNAAWANVEKAIARIKAHMALDPVSLYNLPERQLAALVRPAGYFRVKAARLRALLALISEQFGGDFGKLTKLPTNRLRETLLSVNGIGPETADDIVLYAANRPVFVVDAYTRRIFGRHCMVDPKADYEKIRHFFESALGRKPKLFKEYHALIVYTGKHFCRKRPRCETCPLARLRPVNLARG